MHCYYYGKVFYTDPITGKKGIFMGCSHPKSPSKKAHDCSYCDSFTTKVQALEENKQTKIELLLKEMNVIVLNINVYKKWVEIFKYKLNEIENEIKEVNEYGHVKTFRKSTEEIEKELNIT